MSRAARAAEAAAVESRIALLRDTVMRDAHDRPGVYRMIAPDGEIVYVGKAKKLRTRLLGYFRARYPSDKAARILREAGSIVWEYVPSEFAALLLELRQIKRWRPRLNVAMKYDARHYAFIRVAPGPAPRFQVVRTAGNDSVGTYYGPFHGATQLGEAVRELNDALGLRDCRLDMPMHFADQVEFADAPGRTPGCIRFEVGKCLGPCVAGTTVDRYRAQFDAAIAFCTGASELPIATLRDAMVTSSDRLEFERAAALRDKVARLESLRDQFGRLRFAVESLSFVYRVPGFHGDDRAYVIRRGRVRGEYSARDAAPSARAQTGHASRDKAQARTARAESRERAGAPVPAHEVDELMLISSWFRRFPHELERTTPLERDLTTRTA